MGGEAYANTLRLPLVSADHLGQRRDGQLGSARELAQIYSRAFFTRGAMSDVCFKQRAFKQGTGEGQKQRHGGGFPGDCKKAAGRESFPSFRCCNKYACTSFCIVSVPCFVSERL